MSKEKELQKMYRLYKEETGHKEVNPHDLARWLQERGYAMPEPVSAVDRLARDISRALRQETKTDPELGQPYRVNHMYRVERDGEQIPMWVDIDDATRPQMHASTTQRREQIVGDITQLTFDADHWNRVNPKEEPIVIDPDFGLDVELRRNMPPVET